MLKQFTIPDYVYPGRLPEFCPRCNEPRTELTNKGKRAKYNCGSTYRDSHYTFKCEEKK